MCGWVYRCVDVCVCVCVRMCRCVDVCVCVSVGLFSTFFTCASHPLLYHSPPHSAHHCQLSRQVVSDHPRLRAESGRMIVKLLDAMPWESSHLVARGLARMAPGLKAVLKDTLVPRLVSGVDARTALGFVVWLTGRK